MELAKCLFVRKNVKKIQEKFLLLKSFYYICTRGNSKIRAQVHFPLLSISCEPKSAEGKPSK